MSDKALGRLYGKASRMIAQQRKEIARLRLHIMAARTKCTCRAWWDVYDEIRSEDQIAADLARTRDELRAIRNHELTDREDPRCTCMHFWADHEDGGRCRYTWDKWDGTRMVRQQCHGDCQKFRPWQYPGRRTNR